jgi:ribosomal-protein-alanine N-acetyltransferase
VALLIQQSELTLLPNQLQLTTVQLRPANPSDLASIISIERASDMAAHWNESEYSSASEKGRQILVAELASNIVGFLVVSTAVQEWELENIAVDPTQRNRGVGRALMSALIEHAKEDGALEIRQEIRRSNINAQALATGSGFIQQGKRSEYYREPPEDALLFKYIVRNGEQL